MPTIKDGVIEREPLRGESTSVTPGTRKFRIFGYELSGLSLCLILAVILFFGGIPGVVLGAGVLSVGYLISNRRQGGNMGPSLLPTFSNTRGRFCHPLELTYPIHGHIWLFAILITIANHLLLTSDTSCGSNVKTIGDLPKEVNC
jgi:hypothetical protein